MIDRQYLTNRLLPIDHIESDNKRLHNDRARLKPILEANNQIMRESFLKAGVLIPLVMYPGEREWQVILTRRAKHLKHHPGEISFPGGRYESTDKNLRATAIRETHEEIGIDSAHIELIGKLPTQATTSQYHVTPYVAIINHNHHITIDSNEVAEAFTVPLNFVIDQNNHQSVTRNINGQTFSYYQIEYNQYKIWGATAQMLVRLAQRLADSINN